MSYLNTPTIVFTGDIQLNVNTVNNDVRHYDNAQFMDSFQEPLKGAVLNGWWNPAGGSTVRFVDCSVVRCIDEHGCDVPTDALMGAEVSGPKDRSSGKMLDIDPQMQMTSEMWGVSLLFTGSDGQPLLSAELHPAGFRDMQKRQFGSAPNGQPFGGVWSSSLENLAWGNLSSAPTLAALQKVSPDSLAINLTIFGFYYSHVDGRYSLGRVLGTIGPRQKIEPMRFAASRRLYGRQAEKLSQPFAFSNYVVDQPSQTAVVDLGMSIGLEDALGTLASNLKTPNGDFEFTWAVAKQKADVSSSPTDTTVFDQIRTVTVPGADAPTWLSKTGGIVSIPLDNAQFQALQEHQLALIMNNQVCAIENADGYFGRCDQNVLRLDVDRELTTDFFVYKFGKPVNGAKINVQAEPKMTGQGGSGKPLKGKDGDNIPIPPINVPPGVVTVHTGALTDRNGKVTFKVTGGPPNRPRGYLDGQMYLFSFDVLGANFPISPVNEYINVHQRDDFAIVDSPTWGDVAEIWIQFANLYPIMSRHIVDMKVPAELIKRKELLLFAFNLDISDPMYMPATRDLSHQKMAVLKNWLNNPSTEPAASAMAAAFAAPLEGVDFGGDDPLARITRIKGGLQQADTQE